MESIFEFLDEDAPDPVGHRLIDAHMVFDVKADFTRKARLVAGRHLTDPPSSITMPVLSVENQFASRFCWQL